MKDHTVTQIASQDQNSSVVAMRLAHKPCNICKKDFRPKNRFECFCKNCREESELVRFADWLPEADFGFGEDAA